MNKLNKRNIKKRNIAQKCQDLFFEHGFNNISVSQIAKTANIGKGTIYEYFTNKEDIVCELMDCLQENYEQYISNQIKNAKGEKNKAKKLFSIFIEKETTFIHRREIYKQFLVACMIKPNNKLLNYNHDLRKKYISLLQKISPSSDASKIYDCIVGLFIASQSLIDYNLTEQVERMINNDNSLKN